MKDEIFKIISACPFDLKQIEGDGKDKIINQVKATFVKGNPRSLWLSLKSTPTVVKFEGDYPYFKIPDLITNDELLYMLIDDYNENYYLLEGKIHAIIFFIEECSGLDEYYIITKDLKKFICENDHNQLLYLES